MDSGVVRDYTIAVQSRISQPLLAYYRAREEDLKKGLVDCADVEAFKSLQGRAREIGDIIKLIEASNQNT